MLAREAERDRTWYRFSRRDSRNPFGKLAGPADPIFTLSLSKSTTTTSSSKYNLSGVGSFHINPMINGKGARKKSIIASGRRGMKTCSWMLSLSLRIKCITQLKGQSKVRNVCVTLPNNLAFEDKNTILHSPMMHSITRTMFGTDRQVNVRSISKSVGGNEAWLGGDIPKNMDSVSEDSDVGLGVCWKVIAGWLPRWWRRGKSPCMENTRPIFCFKGHTRWCAMKLSTSPHWWWDWNEVRARMRRGLHTRSPRLLVSIRWTRCGKKWAIVE